MAQLILRKGLAMGKSETMTIPLAAHLDTQTSGAANAGDRAPRANQATRFPSRHPRRAHATFVIP